LFGRDSLAYVGPGKAPVYSQNRNAYSAIMNTFSRRRFLKNAALGAVVGSMAGSCGTEKSSRTGKYAKTGFLHDRSQSVREAFSGPCASVRLPFDRNGAIDFRALRQQVEFVLHAGSKTVILTWGDSLYSLLTDDEVAQVTKAVVRFVNRRALVVAADRNWATPREAEFAAYCAETGADLLMVLPPDWAGSTTVPSLVAHYRAAAEHIPVMVVTNYLGRKPIEFGANLIESLRDQVPGVVALKEDVGGEFAQKICGLVHERWAIIARGQKQRHLDMLPYGVDGYFSLHITFKPEIAWRYWKAVEKQDLDAARGVIRDCDKPLFDYLLKLEGGFDAGVHGLLEVAGLGSRYRRAPYYSFTEAQMADLKDFLKRYS